MAEQLLTKLDALPDGGTSILTRISDEQWPIDVVEDFLFDLSGNSKLIAKFADDADLLSVWKGLKLQGLDDVADHVDELADIQRYLDANATKSFDDVADVIKQNGWAKWGDEMTQEFTSKQISDYVKLASKNTNSSKVMLGMWNGGKSTSYISRSGKEYTYFDFGDNWDEAYNLVNKNNDEIWRINKEFIDQQHKIGKEFWFSHDPFSPKNEQFYAREINYLIDLGVKDFTKVGDLWKAIW